LPLIICLTLWIMDGKRMPMLIWFWAWKGWFEMGFFFGWKLWKSCGMRRLFWVCIYRVFFWGWTAILFQWRGSWVHVQRMRLFCYFGYYRRTHGNKGSHGLAKGFDFVFVF
jgi:hypothetical protein